MYMISALNHPALLNGNKLKMDNENQPRFKMQLEDEAPESVIQEERTDFRIEKLGNRITLISILIPVLIIIIFGMAYFDMKGRLTSSESTKTMEVSSLSKEIQSKFSSLSLKQAKLEESIKKLDSSKADEKDMKMSMAEAEKSLSRLRKQADAISSSVKTLRKELNANSAEIKSFSGIIEKLQTDFSNLLAQTIVEERLVQELGSQRKIYQDMMSLITQKLEARINDIDEDISTLKKHIVSLAKSSKSTQSYKKSEPRTTTTKKPSVKQQTDNIQELDIKK